MRIGFGSARRQRFRLALPLGLVAATCGYPASASTVETFRSALAAMVQADTANPPGNEDRITKIVAERLKQAGINSEVIPFAPGRSNLVARLKGNGKQRPLLLLAHIDVVPATGQTWSSPPHTMTEKDGFLVGRGVSDDLGMAAAALATFIELRHAPLRRDVILALTGDEESGGAGAHYLLEHRPELLDAEIALNEGGAPVLGDGGKVVRIDLQMAEKAYADFIVEAKGTTGHSSVPLADNAIYHLSEALARLHKAPPMPAHLLPVTREYFRERAAFETGALQSAMRQVSEASGELPADALAELEKDPTRSATLRTTCIPTLVSGGTKENALPPSAQATINCRILPDESVASVKQRLVDAIADASITVRTLTDHGVAPSVPPQGVVPDAIAAVAREMWPGAKVVPSMSRGATDSRFLRLKGIQAYGISPFPETEADMRRAHGIDERLPTASIEPGLLFMHKLVVALAGAG